MQKLAMLQELSKHDTETQSKQMLLEKWHQQICWLLGCRKPSISTKCNICKMQ